MSKTRKILSVVLAAALVFALAIPAFAVSSVNFESAADAATYTQEWSLAEPVFIEDGDETFPDHAGEYYIDVVLKTNYPTGAVEFEVETTGDVVFEGAMLYDYYSYTNEEDEMCWNADIRFNNNKVVLVPDSSVADDAIVFTTADDEGYPIATIFVSGTSGTAAIKDDSKNAENPGGTLIATRLNPAKVTGDMYVGQKATVGDAVTIGEAAEPADLALKTGAQAGIVIDKNKTFGGAYDGAVYGFIKTSNTVFRTATYLTDNLEATNNGSLDFAASTGTVYGTGTVITVKNSDDTVSKKYVVIIFGDVNGDAMINQNDAPAAKKNLVSWNKTNTIQNFAANCQAQAAALVLYQLNQNDLAAIKLYAGNKANKFSETDLAAKQFANTTYYK